FFGRLGLSLAATGQLWSAFSLGVAIAAIGVAPLPMPSGFLHWFVAITGLVVVARPVWPWIGQAMSVASPPRDGQLLGRVGGQWFGGLLLVAALALPLTPFGDQKTMDLSVLILTYVMLGWGLNIVVGLAGLLDLGYVAFYAVGAYSYALLSTQW